MLPEILNEIQRNQPDGTTYFRLTCGTCGEVSRARPAFARAAASALAGAKASNDRALSPEVQGLDTDLRNPRNSAHSAELSRVARSHELVGSSNDGPVAVTTSLNETRRGAGEEANREKPKSLKLRRSGIKRRRRFV